MSGFVAGGPSAPFNLVNDGFWPDIDANELRAAQRIDSTITNARLEMAIVNAMLSVNGDLVHRRAEWIAAGHATLADVPSLKVNDVSGLVHAYNRAVYSAVSAEVAERYRSFDATNSGEKKAAEEVDSIAEYRRDQRWAVRDLLGIGRTTVELI